MSCPWGPAKEGGKPPLVERQRLLAARSWPASLGGRRAGHPTSLRSIAISSSKCPTAHGGLPGKGAEPPLVEGAVAAALVGGFALGGGGRDIFTSLKYSNSLKCPLPHEGLPRKGASRPLWRARLLAEPLSPLGGGGRDIFSKPRLAISFVKMSLHGGLPREGGNRPLWEGALVAARLWPASLAALTWRRAAPALRPLGTLLAGASLGREGGTSSLEK